MEQWNERIADNPDFIPATLDRIKLCVHRDKNRPCVVIWSMGNECAYGCTFEEALKWTKRFDTTRLTHYESAYYRSRKRKYDYSNIDLHSRMYPAFGEMEEYLAHEPDKPYLLVEYSHAMGNSSGDLEDYFRMIEKYDVMCGGFVWEWCDHAVYKGRAENGKAIYYYGGDHEETIHDGNFCVDGLVYPDRTPHTGLLEYKNVYRPTRVRSYDQKTGRMLLHNYLDFTDLQDELYLTYEVNCDGKITESGVRYFTEPLPPHTDGVTFVKPVVPERGKCYLRVQYHAKRAGEAREEGAVLGFDEILLENADGRNQKALWFSQCQNVRSESVPKVTETDRYLTIHGENFLYRWNKLTGLFEDMKQNDRAILTKPMELNIWRAPTDNDRKIKLEWLNAHYHESGARAYESFCEIEGGTVLICSRMAVTAPTVQPVLKIRTVWKIAPDGMVGVRMEVCKDPEFPELPRFGLRLFLPQDYDTVTFYGLGPMESYPDKRRAAAHGEYTAKVEELHEDYLRPQENGSHADCDYVVVGNEKRRLAVTAPKPFSFNASVYTQEELGEKKHAYELTPYGGTVLCIDYAQSGIGSNSCGPALQEQYKIGEQFVFEAALLPMGEGK